MMYENKDCVDFLKSLQDRSMDLIILDPPYYKVVNDDWDNQWFTIDKYLSWSKEWISEVSRVSKMSASLWIFGFPQQLSYLLPILESVGFTFRQQIVVNKGLQAVAGRTSNKLKMFPTATESIFFFHYEARNQIRDILQSEVKRLNLNGAKVNAHLGKAITGGGAFACMASMKKPLEHRVYPTKQDWLKLQEIMNLPKYEDYVYKFNLQPGLTDVWDDINFYDRKEKKIHSTQKPIKLIDRLISCSSNENDNVLDIFAGSATTAISCIKQNRNFFGCEKDENYFVLSNQRISDLAS